MAKLTSDQARQLLRQPAVWVSPTSFPAGNVNRGNVVAAIMPMLPNRAFAGDTLKLATEDSAGPLAAPIDPGAAADLPDTPYLSAVGSDGEQRLEMKLIASGVEIPDNLDRDLYGGRWRPKSFQVAALINAVRGEVERQLVVGDSAAEPLEFSGFLAPDFPRQRLETGPDPLAAIDAAIESVVGGSGWSGTDALFCHQRAGLEIIRLLRASGFCPPEIYVEEIDRSTLAYPSAQGWVPIVYNNYFPIDAHTHTSSIVAVHLRGENGVALATPMGTPNIRMSEIRQPQRPSTFCIAEFKCVLAGLDSGKTVELAGFPVSPSLAGQD